eukprot:750097-Hanusia_phi.AAC.1
MQKANPAREPHVLESTTAGPSHRRDSWEHVSHPSNTHLSLNLWGQNMTVAQIYSSIVAVLAVLAAAVVSEICGVGSPDTEGLKSWSEGVKNHTILLQYKKDGGFAFTMSKPCTSQANTPKAICTFLAAVSLVLLLAYYKHQVRLDHLLSSNWRGERKTWWSYLKVIFGTSVESKRFQLLLLEIAINVVHPFPFLSMQFLTNCYIFKVGFFVRDFRIESLLCGFCFIKLYHLFRLYRLFAFRRQYNKHIIQMSRILGVGLTRNEIPTTARFTMKFTIIRLPIITTTFLFFVYMWVVSYLIRLAEAPFQAEFYINIWNPMVSHIVL